MSDKNTLPSTPPDTTRFRVPVHGHGRLRVLQPGETANPTGRSGRYAEVQRLAAEASPEAMKVLIGIMRDADEETRARIVAIEGIFNRAFGRPREMQPEAAAPPLDLTAVSEEKLLLIIKALEAAKEAKRAQGGDGEA
jgi:hypothetical protein